MTACDRRRRDRAAQKILSNLMILNTFAISRIIKIDRAARKGTQISTGIKCGHRMNHSQDLETN